MSKVNAVKNYAERVFIFSVTSAMHMVALYSKYFLWKNKTKIKCKYELCSEFSGLWPIVWPESIDSNEGELYLYFGTNIVVLKSPDDEFYRIFIDAKEVGLEFLIDNYSEKTVEPFLFNINLFNKKA